MPKKTVPIYEYSKKINGQTRYYIRPYINGSQTTIRLDESGNMWLGKEGYRSALLTLEKMQNSVVNIRSINYDDIRTKYLELTKELLKESTYVSYKEVLKNQIDPHFNKHNCEITYKSVFYWHQDMEKKELSTKYKNKCHTILSEMLQVGIKYFGLEKNYEKDLEPFKSKRELPVETKVRYIMHDDFKKFMSVIQNDLWHAVFYTLYYTGLRKGELLALTWEDISFDTKKIHINKTYTDRSEGKKYDITPTKNYKNRHIDMNNGLCNVLKEWYNIESQKETFQQKQFVFGGDEPLSTTTMTRKKNEYFKLANLTPITIHEFRHSHVSLIVNESLKNNYDMEKIFLMLSDRMGHTIQVMQETYMHLFPNVQTDIVNMLNALG